MTKMIPVKNTEIINQLSLIDSDLLLIVVDTYVYNTYKNILKFENLKKKYHIWSTPQGENVKNLKQYESCINFFLEKGIHRNAHLIAIGGGAISDFAGFVASTVLRGIKWSVVPTTLLSFVDASIGGKVGLNTNTAKNQIGAFHQPENSINCFELIESLPELEMMSGKGEILKYFFLSKKIQKLILKKDNLNNIISACSEYKLEIVENDFKEEGKRKILNLGHTFGHCFEKIYNLSHGVSVIWGMFFLFLLFEQNENIKDLNVAIKNLDLSFEESPWFKKTFPTEQVFNLLIKDKKITSNESIELIVIKDKKVVIKQYKLDQLKKMVETKAVELSEKKI